MKFFFNCTFCGLPLSNCGGPFNWKPGENCPLCPTPL